MTISRRHFLSGSLGTAALAGVGAAAGCSSVHSGSGKADTGAPASSTAAPSNAGASAGALKKVTGSMTFAVWASPSEQKGFSYAIAKFQAANPGAKVQLKVVPYDGFFSNIDRGIQAGTAPDIFRVDYTTIGKYSRAGALLDLSPYFAQSDVDAFVPSLWQAIKYNGRPYGVPHQTDTTCVFYDKSAFQAAGITSVPATIDSAWTWDEFSAVAVKLRKSLPANKFPFAYDWTQAGAFRWLSWLYQSGGTLLTADLKKCAFPSGPATTAMDYTKSFFDKKWVPANNTVKTSVYSDNFFLNQTVAMSFIGDFLVPEIADKKNGYKGGSWGATFMPQDKAVASDLGGNAMVARKDVKNPDLAAAFLKFLVSEDAMKYFCEQAVELPTLRSLATSRLNYAFRPDVVEVCAKQAAKLSDTIVRESTVAGFADINTILQDQLELAFHGQSSAQTISAITSKVNTAIGA